MPAKMLVNVSILTRICDSGIMANLKNAHLGVDAFRYQLVVEITTANRVHSLNLRLIKILITCPALFANSLPRFALYSAIITIDFTGLTGA